MIATWNVGTQFAGLQIDLDGTVAGRTGTAAEIDLLENVLADALNISRAHLSLNGTSVMVVPKPGDPAQAWLTLSDGEIDRPANDWFGKHVNDLAKGARGEVRTLMKHVLRRIIRYAKRRGVTKTAFLTSVGAMWDAVTVNGD